MWLVLVRSRDCFFVESARLSLHFQIQYALLAGLAGYGLSDTAANGDSSYYRSCELEAQGKLAAGEAHFTILDL